MKTELDKFYGLIEEIKVAMMTTRRPDGHLESRAMANQKQAAGADLWFVTAEGTGKLRDIAHDPHVNLAYYKTGSYEWVSASGVARVSKDRATIRELYEPDWKAWFGADGDPRHGTADDPRIVLIADWDRVFALAAERAVAIEIDGDPARQDLDHTLASRARDAGCLFALDSDAHSTASWRMRTPPWHMPGSRTFLQTEL